VVVSCEGTALAFELRGGTCESESQASGGGWRHRSRIGMLWARCTTAVVLCALQADGRCGARVSKVAWQLCSIVV
jgi:hypothetical protein